MPPSHQDMYGFHYQGQEETSQPSRLHLAPPGPAKQCQVPSKGYQQKISNLNINQTTNNFSPALSQHLLASFSESFQTIFFPPEVPLGLEISIIPDYQVLPNTPVPL
ncbi:uncharacterized protein PGTG_10517 [Puccinia graminis f. sp. tritici CRL 75-36-700-3]|uniref:Uncharacterized protein n=1 Tax=Puccinia graminis f. sp. tritici (strain CRL 75-36-700-3 / race SCCL) TaxID=418459 RepID=E3KIL4_PUCGT|nr:uncharacterized protein PGTG_10517 [Puccinia graminis f. sp. tritici CRL 75-36-700-3]EFP84139.1 hypothetical protein PGTG_10517 [Puccinia graminis f. sp. tritici CRL 75-36-700-3]